jgi:hypothetical protein
MAKGVETLGAIERHHRHAVGADLDNESLLTHELSSRAVQRVLNTWRNPA